MAEDRLRKLKDQLESELRRSRIIRQFGAVVALVVCLGIAGAGLFGVLGEGGWLNWAMLVFSLLCAAAYGRQVAIDCGFIMPRSGEAGRPTHVVSVTEEGVMCRSGRDKAESVSWAALRQVVLQAADFVPVGDVYWLLIGDHGTGCVIPIDAEGSDELLARMQQRLPGFDNEAVVAMMGALDGAAVVWQRETADGSGGVSR